MSGGIRDLALNEAGLAPTPIVAHGAIEYRPGKPAGSRGAFSVGDHVLGLAGRANREAVMGSRRITWIAPGLVAALLAAATVAAQAQAEEETVDAGAKLIDRPYTAVFEVFMEESEFAAEVPFSGETSDFDGLCSEPVDVVWRFRWGGLDSVFGQFTGTLFLCVKAEWGVDADGAPAMTGVRYTDFSGTFSLPDGSTIDSELTLRWDGFDAETGQLTSATAWTTSGGGTGRLAGAALHGSGHCRRVRPEEVEAGDEPQLCVLHGMIRYDPLAGAGQ